MTADLRRLAEAGIAGTVGRVTPETWQAILDLLDERDYLRMTRRGFSSVTLRQAEAAERRVAALEEAYKRLASQRHSLSEQPVHMEHIFRECPHPDCQAARALLAAAPSEPPDEYMCPNCVTPWKCNGPHIPAALPADERCPRCGGRGLPSGHRHVGGPFPSASEASE